jgi:hypothetical protein
MTALNPLMIHCLQMSASHYEIINEFQNLYGFCKNGIGIQKHN